MSLRKRLTKGVGHKRQAVRRFRNLQQSQVLSEAFFVTLLCEDNNPLSIWHLTLSLSPSFTFTFLHMNMAWL